MIRISPLPRLTGVETPQRNRKKQPGAGGLLPISTTRRAAALPMHGGDRLRGVRAKDVPVHDTKRKEADERNQHERESAGAHVDQARVFGRSESARSSGDPRPRPVAHSCSP